MKNNIKQIIYAVYKHNDKNSFISYHLSKDVAQIIVEKLNSIEIEKVLTIRNQNEQIEKFLVSYEYKLANYIEKRYKSTLYRLLKKHSLLELKNQFPELYIQYIKYGKLKDRLVKLFNEKFEVGYYLVTDISKIIPEWLYSIKEIEVQD
jgi:hypothetical protein